MTVKFIQIVNIFFCLIILSSSFNCNQQPKVSHSIDSVWVSIDNHYILSKHNSLVDTVIGDLNTEFMIFGASRDNNWIIVLEEMSSPTGAGRVESIQSLINIQTKKKVDKKDLNISHEWCFDSFGEKNGKQRLFINFGKQSKIVQLP